MKLIEKLCKYYKKLYKFIKTSKLFGFFDYLLVYVT